MDSPVEADMVVGVPESGNPAAQGYAMESGIPYGTAFIKNSYVGGCRSKRSSCKNQFSSIFTPLLFWNGYSFRRSVDCLW